MQNEQTPAAGRLTAESARLLVKGDRLKLRNACTYLKRNGIENGQTVTVRNSDGAYIDLAEIAERQGSHFSRFDFVERPASSSSVVQGDAGGVERDEAFCPAYYAAHMDHARRALADGKPYSINADGAMALIAQAASDRAALRPQPSGETRGLGWLDVKDAPQDGSEILLNHRTHGIIQGWFSKGEWSGETLNGPREYSGDMWILGDDLFQDEVEYGENQEVIPSGVTGWLPLDALFRPAPVASSDQPEQGGGMEIDPWTKEDIEDLISDAIGDSMDMDWTYRDGAKAVLAALHKEGFLRFDLPAEPAEARVRELADQLSRTERDYSELRESYDAVVAKLTIERAHGDKQSRQLSKAKKGIISALAILGGDPGDAPLSDRERIARQTLAALQQAGEVG